LTHAQREAADATNALRVAQHRARKAEKAASKARNRADRNAAAKAARALARGATAPHAAPPPPFLQRADARLERSRRVSAAAASRLADAVARLGLADDGVLAAGAAASAALEAERNAPRNDAAAARAARKAATALADAEHERAHAADALDAEEDGVAAQWFDTEEDVAATPPSPAPPGSVGGRAARRGGARRSSRSRSPPPPSPLPGQKLYGVHLFGGTGAPALSLFCICAIALFYVEISSAAQVMLRLAIAAGLIPAGVIWTDIRTLFGSKEFQVAVARVREAGGALLFTAGWPCQVRVFAPRLPGPCPPARPPAQPVNLRFLSSSQGNSTRGKRKGMKHRETGLLVVLLDGVLQYLPEFVFLENVPPAASNGQLDYIRQRLVGRYEVRYCTRCVSMLGGLIVRNRLYVLLIRKRAVLPLLPRDCVTSLLARCGPPPARCVETKPAMWKAACGLAGNAAHPACSLAAFAHLAQQEVDLPVVKPPHVRLFFDPAVYRDASKTSKAKTPLLTSVVPAVYFPAPRKDGGWGTYNNGFTSRGLGDLATCVRYARCTPERMRGWPVNPAWVAWLMGFPAAYCALFLMLV